MTSSPDIEKEQKNDEEHLQMIKLKKVVSKDITDAKKMSEEMVKQIKTNINNLLSRLKTINVCSDSFDSLTADQSMTGRQDEMKKLIRQSITELREKAALDIQVVQLYDEYIAKETAHKVKTECVGKYLKLLMDKVSTDFRNYNEATEDIIENIESELENYIKRVTDGKDGNLNSSIGMKVLLKALNDIENKRNCTLADIEKTKHFIHENIQVLLINPNGRKTEEELQSEEFVKENIIDLTNKVGRDLSATKEITDRIAKRTKEVIGEKFVDLNEEYEVGERSQLPNFSIEQHDDQNSQIDAIRFLKKLHNNAVVDFQETDRQMQEAVGNLCEAKKDILKQLSKNTSQ